MSSMATVGKSPSGRHNATGRACGLCGVASPTAEASLHPPRFLGRPTHIDAARLQNLRSVTAAFERVFAETRPVTCRCAYCDFTVSGSLWGARVRPGPGGRRFAGVREAVRRIGRARLVRGERRQDQLEPGSLRGQRGVRCRAAERGRENWGLVRIGGVVAAEVPRPGTSPPRESLSRAKGGGAASPPGSAPSGGLLNSGERGHLLRSVAGLEQPYGAAQER